MYLNSLLSTSAPENCQMCQETDGWKRLPQGLAANRWHLALAEDQVFLGTWQMAGKLMELFMGKCTETDASMGNRPKIYHILSRGLVRKSGVGKSSIFSMVEKIQPRLRTPEDGQEPAPTL